MIERTGFLIRISFALVNPFDGPLCHFFDEGIGIARCFLQSRSCRWVADAAERLDHPEEARPPALGDLVDEDVDGARVLARLDLNVLAYLLAFTFFAIIYHTRSRSLVTATLTLLAAALLALDLLSVAEVQFWRVLLVAGIVGLVVGESTWALNYWQISAWAGGLFLLLVFYIVVNVAHQHLLERLSVSTLVEFAVVAIVVLVIILLGAP